MKELKQYDHIYFLGIGGIGMSAIARCCLMMGIQVSGYDRLSGAITDALIQEGAHIHFDDDPSSISQQPDLVIYTPAIPTDSKLKVHFTETGIDMVKRSEALGSMTAGIDTIAVAGTHGKTTTSSMISYLLHAMEVKHTALLGGIAANYQSNFHSESFELMVVEADEYDRSFWSLHPKWIVVTAMDPDHLDIYGTHEEMLAGYRQFISQIQPGGMLLLRNGLQSMLGESLRKKLESKQVTTMTYDVDEGDFHCENLNVDEGLWHWNMVTPKDRIDQMTLMMPGRHNVQNATAACAMALEVGGKQDKLAEALRGYKGVSRRFEIRYKNEEFVMIDDYAHHPEELIAAITAARETFGGPVTGVFQPHLYSRTRDLAQGFAEALDLLDYPVLIDIYPAREVPIAGVSSQIIYDRMKNSNKKWCREDTWVTWIEKQKPRVLITLGAGDLDKHIPELIGKLYKNE
jgi:UDP-N-acetylmuramate--alanine ligase